MYQFHGDKLDQIKYVSRFVWHVIINYVQIECISLLFRAIRVKDNKSGRQFKAVQFRTEKSPRMALLIVIKYGTL